MFFPPKHDFWFLHDLLLNICFMSLPRNRASQSFSSQEELPHKTQAVNHIRVPLPSHYFEKLSVITVETNSGVEKPQGLVGSDLFISGVPP